MLCNGPCKNGKVCRNHATYFCRTADGWRWYCLRHAKFSLGDCELYFQKKTTGIILSIRDMERLGKEWRDKDAH